MYQSHFSVPLSYDLTTFYIFRFDHFLDSRAEICQIFRWFFGKFKTSKRHSEINWPLENSKGHIYYLALVICQKSVGISKCLFDILNFPKDQQKIWQISALESKKWSNRKIKAHYNDFDTNYIKYYKKVSLFCWYDHFLYSKAEICQNFRWFFGKFKISKRHSEINWPLTAMQTIILLR